MNRLRVGLLCTAVMLAGVPTAAAAGTGPVTSPGTTSTGTDPSHAFTVNREHARPMVLDSTSTTSISASNPWGDDLRLTASLADGSSMTATVMPPVGKRFASGTYPLGNGIDSTHAAVGIDGVGYTCSTIGGTMTVLAVERSASGSVMSLAADFEMTCDYQVGHQSGQFRWNSTEAYAGFTGAGADLDPQGILEGPGGTRRLTLTAAGTRALSPTGVRIVDHDPTSVASFAVAGDTCRGRTLQPATSCTVDVTMTPLAFGLLDVSVEVATSQGVTTYLPLSGVGTASSKGTFHAVPSTRILDTRRGTGGRLGALGPGQTLTLSTGGAAGVPQRDVAAVVLNVTVTGPTADGWLTVYPADRVRPTVSALNFRRGQTRANLVTVPVSPDGTVRVANATGTTHVVADLLGYYSGHSRLESSVGVGSQYQVLEPHRVVDTRSEAPLLPDEVMDVSVDLGSAELNAHLTGVALNITAVSPTAAGYLSVWDGAGKRPMTSSLNFAARETVPNLVVVRASTGSNGVPRFAIANSSLPRTDVLVDILGLFEKSGGTGVRYRSVAPHRVVDTRSGLGGVKPAIPSATTRSFTVPANTLTEDTVSVVGNLTAVKPTASTFLTAWAAGTARPGTSSLNAPAGRVTANGVLTPVSKGSGFSVYNASGSTPILVDIMGTMDSYPPQSAGATAVSQDLLTRSWTPWMVATARR